ncbi:hypothetical protein GCM10023336_42840 [Streptomyces similanensis]|uniref:DUF4232 domain-containing protein n=2 Tax=Streptomyces similanensis TaxID=1274988 RepID=A0ABP9KT05_9ACTN
MRITMRTTTRDHRKHTVLAAAAVAALSLGLTACGGGDGTGTKDEGAAASSRNATAVKPDATSKSDGGAKSDGAASDGSGTAKGGTAAQTAVKSKAGGSGTAAGGSDGSGKSSASAPACAYGDVRITVQKADETPTEHVVLTAKNISGHSCRLLQYPLIAFGPIQTAKDIPAVAKSKPEAPVVLAPGAPAYANVRIANGGVHEDNKVVTSFTVNLFAPDGPAEGSVDVKAPAGGLAVDEAVAKTGYWTEELRNGADEF